MVRKRTNNPGEQKRFTVSLEKEDYDRLREIAKGHRPRLSLQYVFQYAIHRFLENADEHKIRNLAEEDE